MTARTVAVVTGAGSPTGIGFATARALARAGHCILIVSTSDRIKDRAAELRAEGHEAHAVVADLTGEPDVERLHEHAEALGDVSVLVNNAGMAVLGEMDPLGNLERLDLGFGIEAATLDTSGAVCIPRDPLLAGGTLTVSGIPLVVPCNTIVQLPATSMASFRTTCESVPSRRT